MTEKDYRKIVPAPNGLIDLFIRTEVNADTREKQTGIYARFGEPNFHSASALIDSPHGPAEVARALHALAGLIERNCQPAWQLRVIAEKTALDEKIIRLKAFLESDASRALDPDDLSLLCDQQEHMLHYSDILDMRIARF